MRKQRNFEPRTYEYATGISCRVKKSIDLVFVKISSTRDYVTSVVSNNTVRIIGEVGVFIYSVAHYLLPSLGVRSFQEIVKSIKYKRCWVLSKNLQYLIQKRKTFFYHAVYLKWNALFTSG